MRYEGADWRERRAIVAKIEPLFGLDVHPDPRKSRRSWVSWLQGALSVDGWLMPRHAPMPDHEDTDFRYRLDRVQVARGQEGPTLEGGS